VTYFGVLRTYLQLSFTLKHIQRKYMFIYLNTVFLVVFNVVIYKQMYSNRRLSIPSFLPALQLGVSSGLLNNLPPFFSPSEADYLVSEQFSF
jgi:hypothetical protein